MACNKFSLTNGVFYCKARTFFKAGYIFWVKLHFSH
jgi:hypothetical protein